MVISWGPESIKGQRTEHEVKDDSIKLPSLWPHSDPWPKTTPIYDRICGPATFGVLSQAFIAEPYDPGQDNWPPDGWIYSRKQSFIQSFLFCETAATQQEIMYRCNSMTKALHGTGRETQASRQSSQTEGLVSQHCGLKLLEKPSASLHICSLNMNILKSRPFTKPQQR